MIHYKNQIQYLSKGFWNGIRAFGSNTERIGLFSAKIFSALIGLGVNFYLANTLGVLEFGKYAFTIAVLTFLSLFFDFGFFASAASLIAATEEEKEKRAHFGALFIITMILSGLFIMAVFVMSFLVDFIFPDKIGSILSSLALLAPGVIAPLFIDQVLKAAGRIRLLSFWYVVMRIGFITAILYYTYTGQLSALSAGFSYTISNIASFLFVIFSIKPEFSNVGSSLRQLVDKQRHFGRPLFTGKLFNLISYNSDKPLLAYFHGATSVGYYSLAMSCAGLSTMLAQSIAAAQFRKFAGLQPISHRLLKWNLIGVLLNSVGSIVGIWVLVKWYLGASYAEVGIIIVPATLALAFQSAYQPYNSWLLANSFGDILRRFLMRNAGINFATNIILIPLIGAFGAACASIIGMASYFGQARYNYRRESSVS